MVALTLRVRIGLTRSVRSTLGAVQEPVPRWDRRLAGLDRRDAGPTPEVIRSRLPSYSARAGVQERAHPFHSATSLQSSAAFCGNSCKSLVECPVLCSPVDRHNQLTHSRL